jgi:hypothetical protein
MIDLSLIEAVFRSNSIQAEQVQQLIADEIS